MDTPSPSIAALALDGLSVDVDNADPRLLYGASPDGQWWAYRDTWAGPGPIWLANAIGRTPLAVGPIDVFAPQAAAFAPDSLHLAVADGSGSLWLIDLATGKRSEVAASGMGDLVFGRSLTFGDRDHLFAELVGSVEVPIPSRIGVLDLRDGAVRFLSDDAWAYGPRPLADGTTAYFHLTGDGSYLARVLSETGQATDIANVGFIHGGVDVAPDGTIAYSDGSSTWVIERGGRPRRLGSGTNPRFGPDGTSVLTFNSQTQQSTLLRLDGTIISTFKSAFVRVTGK